MTYNGQQSININITQLLIAMVASMAIICAFIAYMTNVLVTSKVNALDDIKNPVTTTAPAQSNVAGGLCTDPSITAAAPAPGDALALGGPASTLATLRGGSVSLTYNQSNSSTTNTSNTSTNVDSRYSGNSFALSNTQSWNWNNGNSSTNTSNTTINTTNNTTNTNIQTWDNNNNNGNSSTNTSNTTTNTSTTVNTDNSNNSTNTAVLVPIIL